MTKNEIIKKLHRAIKTQREPIVQAILEAWPDLVLEAHPTTGRKAIEIGLEAHRPNSLRHLIATAESKLL